MSVNFKQKQLRLPGQNHQMNDCVYILTNISLPADQENKYVNDKHLSITLKTLAEKDPEKYLFGSVGLATYLCKILETAYGIA